MKFIFLLLLFPATAFSQVLDLQYTNDVLAQIPEAKRFQAQFEDLTLQGIELGPEDGIPLLFSGGFTSNLTMYRKLLREYANRGFRVFAYNPPGQGAGDLVSLGDNPRWQSFLGLVQAMELMHRTLFEITGEKVVVAGHSMGGMQMRVLALGLEGLLDGHVNVNREKRKAFRDRTAALVPILSPSMAEFGSRLDGAQFEDQIAKMAEFSMRKALPWTMETYYSFLKNTPWYALAWVRVFESSFLRPFDWWNEFWLRSLVGQNIDLAELRAVAPHAMSETIYDEIVDSLQRWNDKKGTITQNGFNMGEAWIRLQRSGRTKLPTLLVIATDDLLAPSRELFREHDAIGGESLVVRGDHILPFFNRDHVKSIVDDTTRLIGLNPCEMSFSLKLAKAASF